MPILKFRVILYCDFRVPQVRGQMVQGQVKRAALGSHYSPRGSGGGFRVRPETSCLGAAVVLGANPSMHAAGRAATA